MMIIIIKYDMNKNILYSFFSAFIECRRNRPSRGAEEEKSTLIFSRNTHLKYSPKRKEINVSDIASSLAFCYLASSAFQVFPLVNAVPMPLRCDILSSRGVCLVGHARDATYVPSSAASNNYLYQLIIILMARHLRILCSTIY